ncbi:MAG: bifunctional demethylmenaquinone methyltransferase/2-methoxy-6-polyprenyl-1,4-benzoquinol methylase UbiE [Paludibacteraceae bacterium]|jgi:demethylmenaquinone methyltransferase/2-methoxy-6-polyprenyl-1,4-benzoquinol methylase|nr:bifunctional demethylmenaquinone methyltransferase/2-methoxy-6-polyprenyl-1,4-benzoquinol methylase UbiE [Paludibacteraceae bacterium]
MDNEKQHIGQLFDRIAGTYDGLNHVLSLNIDKRWRRRAIRMLAPAEQVLDVAIGTADLTIEILRQGKAQHVTGIDLSHGMMAIGEQKVAKRGYAPQVQFDYGSAQQMPYADSSFDTVTCAYGVRNFANMDEGLSEMYRVLRTGGELMVLEFSYPTNPVIRWGYDLYFTHILPFIGNLFSRDKGAYSYLNRSVKNFPYGEAFCQHLRKAGFTQIKATPLTFGISTIYTAVK